MIWIILAIGLLAVLAVVAFLVFIGRRNTSPIAIAMLRTTPGRLTEADIRSAYRRVHKHDPQIHKLTPNDNTDCYVLISDSLPPMAVIDARRPYADAADMQQTAARCEHPDLRKALVEHTAWVSVDAMGVKASIGRDKRHAIYRLLAPLAAEFLDDNCMLLYLPAEDRVARPGDESIKSLREGAVAELFGDPDLHAPMFPVDANDAAINAAIAEARSRLPELCTAWERIGAPSHAMIKVRFPTDTANSNELIWLSIASMSDGGFVGTIENTPVHPSIPAKGASVSVNLDDIVDWAYVDAHKQPHGLFVDRALMKRGR